MPLAVRGEAVRTALLAAEAPLTAVPVGGDGVRVVGEVTVADAPAARRTRWKPSSWSGGWPEADGSVTYSWATSAPEREPVLVTVAVTVAAPPAVSGPTLRLLNENVVYDRPYPNGNSGVRPLLADHRAPTPMPPDSSPFPPAP